jgi:hypothetical protein
MLPMKLWEFWQPLILIYLVTIFYCMRLLLHKKVDATAKWYFFIAIYGLGIFSYYQGRSHVWSIMAVNYPAVMLGGFLAVDLLAACRSAGGLRRLCEAPWRYKVIGLLLCLLLPAIGIVNFFRTLPDAIDYATNRSKCPVTVVQNAKLFEILEKRLSNLEAVIFSPIASYLHVKSHSYSALPFSSPAEIILLSQVRDTQKLLDRDDTKQVVIVAPYPPYLQYLHFDQFLCVLEKDNMMILEKNPIRNKR